jgi:hypothetical protein
MQHSYIYVPPNIKKQKQETTGNEFPKTCTAMVQKYPKFRGSLRRDCRKQVNTRKKFPEMDIKIFKKNLPKNPAIVSSISWSATLLKNQNLEE